jgi:cyclic beta-1,2-glucan synthetase
LFLNSYQRIAPLTIGELWAWPSMLTLALVENLRRLADAILESRHARIVADDYLLHADADSPSAWPAGIHHASIVQLLLRTREYGREAPVLRGAVAAHLDARQRTPSAASTSVRASRRSRSPIPSPAFGCARRWTGASTSSG